MGGTGVDVGEGVRVGLTVWVGATVRMGESVGQGVSVGIGVRVGLLVTVGVGTAGAAQPTSKTATRSQCNLMANLGQGQWHQVCPMDDTHATLASLLDVPLPPMSR